MAELAPTESFLEEERETLTKIYRDILDFSQTDTKTAVVLNFKDLQLLRIKDLQQKLFDLQMRFRLGGIPPNEYQDELKRLDETLLAYGKALQNYEFLSQNTRNSIPKGFTLFGAPEELKEDRRTSLDGGLLPLFFHRSELEDVTYRVPDWVKYTRDKNKAFGGDYIISSAEYRELDGFGREERVRKKQWRERLTMALFGGVALIGPTLIMTLHPGQATSLITASLATLLFALALAFFAKSNTGKDVLGATAAYAAVLVVFVGTSTSPQTTQ